MHLYLFLEDTTFLEVSESARVGRGRECELLIPSNRVSRVHALVGRDERGWFIEDAGSSGGTWLAPARSGSLQPSSLRGAEKIKRHHLVDGDVFVLGTERVTARLREQPLEPLLTRALEDDVAAHPNDAARRQVWVDALLGQDDPLGHWLRAPLRPPLTLGPEAELAWDSGLVRRAVVRDLRTGVQLLRSRLASHLLELIVEVPGGSTANADFVRQLISTRLPALQFVRLRGVHDGPQSLPLAPRLVSLVSS